jgi:hypothetical protein
MKLILHIGTEKTATTTLQQWLYSNKSSLSEQKVYLSDILGKPDNRYLSYFFEHRINNSTGKLFDEQNNEVDFYEGLLDRLSSEIRNASTDHDVFVISSEHFHSRVTSTEDISSLASFLNKQFNEINVVCYFRNQYEMAISAYSTALRVGSSLSINEYLSSKVTPDNYYYNFVDIAENWSGCFGKDNCIFKLYDNKSLVDGDIRKDFLREILPNINGEKIKFKSESTNKSFACLQAAALRAINKHVPLWGGSQNHTSLSNNHLQRQLLLVKSLQRGVLNAHCRSEIDSLFKDSNKKFSAKYFEPMASFDSRDNDLEKETMLSLNEVSEIVADICDALLPISPSKAALVDGDAVALRDIALKIEKKEPLSVCDSLVLMKLAERARPSGPYIRKKVKEYEVKLKSNDQAKVRSGEKSEYKPSAKSGVTRLINILDSKIGYFPIPKVACTSIKQFMYQVENQAAFSPQGKDNHVHAYFKRRLSEKKLASYEFSFVIIRDPIKRFLSAYSNRVTHFKELSRDFIFSKYPQYAEQLPFFDPNMERFIDHLEKYLQIEVIKHHIEPISEHLSATHLHQFSKIYPLENISSLECDLSEVLGRDVKFGRSQTGGRKISLGELSLIQMKTLIDYYKEDYQLLSEFYTADNIMEEWAKAKESMK